MKLRKYIRNLDDIGNRKYNFNIKFERVIYMYVSCYKMNRKTLDKLEDKYKFDSYKKWNEYVSKKYNKYDLDELIEFDRYLNQLKRGITTNNMYWMFFIPIILTIIMTNVFELISTPDFTISSGDNIWINILAHVMLYLIAIILFFIFLILPMMIFIYYIIKPVFKINIDKYFLEDYKEIIDDMIKKNQLKNSPDI